MPDIYAWKKSGWFLVLDFFDGGIPSACDNFVAPQIHRDFHHPFFRNPISSPYFGDIVSDAWKSKWHITHQNHKNIKEHQGNTCVFCHVFLPFPAISCHFLVIVCLFFNNVFNFLAWKQQNQWTIEENQWTSKESQRNYTRKPWNTERVSKYDALRMPDIYAWKKIRMFFLVLDFFWWRHSKCMW